MAGQRWGTFDCYGTLVDWEAGMFRAIDLIAPGNALRLLNRYYEIEPAVEAERPLRPYREVLAETLRRAAAEEDVALRRGAEHVLSETLPDWPVFPDVAPALSSLRRDGWKLAILSNVDRDLVAGTLKRLPVRFDIVVTAEDSGAYKPALNHFEHFQRLASVAIEDWVHVARSYFHDIVPASRLGVRTVWVNRGQESKEARTEPEAVLFSLEALPETLSGLLP